MLRSRSFQLTTSRRDRHSKTINQAVIYVFQLTTSRRGRPFTAADYAEYDLFNSRPHAEVDYPAHILILLMIFSTHDLTQRSTVRGTPSISTPRNFQLTTSRRGRHRQIERSTLCIHFQLTTSRRGRLSCIHLSEIFTYFSTHDLTQRSTNGE